MTHDLTALAQTPLQRAENVADRIAASGRSIKSLNSIDLIAAEIEYALRAAAVQGEPVALAHVRLEDDGLFADLEVLDGTNLQPSMSPVALYTTAPPPAAGWEEATRYLKKIADLVDDENACDPLDDAISYANKALKALRTTPAATKSADPGGGVLTGNLAKDVAAASKRVSEWSSAKQDYARRVTGAALSNRPAPVAANASAEARLREVLDRIPPQLFWLIGKGRLRAEEPLYGVQIKDGCETIAEGEHDDLVTAINLACEALSPDPHASDCARDGIPKDRPPKGQYNQRDASITAQSPATQINWDDVRGIAPGATGDLSSEEFVRRQRDEWPEPHASDCDKQGER